MTKSLDPNLAPEERLVMLIADLLKVEEDAVVDEANFFEDLYADSIDLLELIMSIEEEFGVEISEADAAKIQTVGEVKAYLRELGKL